MAITIDDKARYRTDGVHRTHAVLNAVPMVVVASAQINQASFTYPLAELTVDNTFGDWTSAQFGQMFTIGTIPGGSDVTYGVLRKTPTSTKAFIDAKSQGDPGYARDIHQPLANDMYITVYKYKPPWGLLSSIRNGVFYKQWELPYAGQGANPDPIVYMGEWRQGFVDPDTGVLRLAFSAVDSYTWNKTLSSFLWDVDGGVIMVGEDDDGAIEVDFEPGFYEVKCRITDDKGKFRWGYRYVWANTEDPDDVDAPFSYAHDVRIISDRRDPLGRSVSFEVDGQLAQDELFPGQAFFMTEYSTFGEETLDDESYLVRSYVGYSTDLGIRTSYKGKNTVINTASPLVAARKVPTASQQITESRAPKNWTECTSLLSNAVGAAWYVSVYHSPYIIDAHDFTFDNYLSQLRRKVFQFQQRDVGSQLQSINPLINGNIGCKSSGTIRLIRHPFYLQSDDRLLLEELWTLEPTDILEELSIPLQYKNAVGQTYGFAYSYNGGEESTPYASLAPGYSQAQGVEQNQMTAFTVPHNTDSQQRVNEITGHQFAIDNPKYPNFSVRIDRNIDIFEPCDVDKFTILDVPADYDPLGFGWVNKRCIPVAVTTEWSYDRGTTVKQITVEFQVESYGVPGVTVPVNRGGANNWLWFKWNAAIYDPYEIKSPELDLDIPFLVAWNSVGRLGRTQNPLEPDVVWKRMTGFLGNVRDASFNYHSPFFDDPTDNLGVWIITDDGLTIRIYYTSDFLVDTPVWSLQKTYTAGSTYKGRARIIGSKQESGFAIAAWKTRKGVYYTRTTNTGTSWDDDPGELTQIFDDADHDNNYLGMAVYGETQAIIAPTGFTNAIDGKYDWKLFVADDKNGSFSLVDCENDDERCLPDCVILTDELIGYVGTEIPEPPAPPDPLEVVEFGVTGFQHYTILGAGETSAFGFPQPSAYSSVNLSGIPSGVGVTVTIDLQASYIFDTASWQIGQQGLNPGFGGQIFNPSYLTRIMCLDEEDEICAIFEVRNGFGWAEGIDAQTLKPTEPIRKFEITVGVSWESDVASGVGYIYIDNIDIRGIQVQRNSQRELKVFNPSSGTWSERSPRDKQLPIHHYGLGFSPISGSDLSMIGADEEGYTHLLNSSSAGASWGRKGRTAASGLKRGADQGLIVFGYGQLGISDDLGSNVYSRLGDWSNKVGEVAKIEGVLGVL